MFINQNLKWKFKPTELHCFNWMFTTAPCFPIKASNVNIIQDPRVFYDTLCERFKNANRRITVSSLYVGTGPLERRLLNIAKENMTKNKELKCHILLDYQRGTRGKVNSITLFRECLGGFLDQCSLSLYQTPRLQGIWSHVLPSRYNELVGLQHMKLYIVDDSVLLSGANCSNDYFQQRQDRYIEFMNNPELADFYSELIDEVSKFSRNGIKNNLSDIPSTKDTFIKEVKKSINEFLVKWRNKQQKSLHSVNKEGSDIDTWIFPLIQMGEFNIRQDEEVTKEILASAPKNSHIRIATGYFNLTDQYASTLLVNCKAKVSLLMAHPNANGFLGASGPAGGIPNAYSLIARMFWEKVVDSRQDHRVQMLEYERSGWTFHAKGLWYYPTDSKVPWMTLVGSANLGERSVRRDLEAQAAIFTTSPQLQVQLHNECKKLHDCATECSRELQRRRAPLWVRASVGIFRTYF